MKKFAVLIIFCLSLSSVCAIDIEREIQACNFVTQYLCILEDLQGQGYAIVRQEMEDNLKTGNLDEKTKKLLSRLSDACDLAESTLQNIDYTNEDFGDNTATMWGENIGFSGTLSLLVGDPTPLIIGVGETIIRQNKLNKENSRAIDIQLRTFNQMLNRYHLELNERRNDLFDEFDIPDNKFIRRSVYKNFLIASSQDGDEAISSLRQITMEYPEFREAWYFYGKKLQQQGKYAEAFEAFSKIIPLEQLIVRKDGLKGKTFTEMGICKYRLNDYNEALELFEAAIPIASGYERLYEFMSYNYYYLGDCNKALLNIENAISLNPKSPWHFRHKACLQLLSGASDDEVWKSINAALANGIGPNCFFNDNVYCEEMRSFMQKEENINKEIPSLTASISYGLFNDDIILYNSKPYPLTNITVNIRISGKDCPLVTNGNKVEETHSITSIPQQGSYTLTNIFSVVNSTPVNIEITFSCDQYIGEWQWSSATNITKRMLNADKSTDSNDELKCATMEENNAAQIISTEELERYTEELKKLAALGYVDAQIELGVCYLEGVGVPQDEAEAVKWFKLAAAQGEASGQLALGVCYLEGVGVPQDEAEAVKWLILSASQECEEAQLILQCLGILW